MQEYVTYEAFGAVGDGVHDDQAAIAAAHAYANQTGRPVKARGDAVYYIGPGVCPAVIMTDTDWNTARFIIDDSAVTDEDPAVFGSNIFEVPPTEAAFSLPLPPLAKGQTHVDLAAAGITLSGDVYVRMVSDERMHYIRRGRNQDSGSPQTDSFILTPAGELHSGIVWDFSRVSSCTAIPVDTTPLTISGGRFTTVANRAESKYNYYGRGIFIRRSHTTVKNVYHEVTDEGGHGAPYRGFFDFTECAFVTLKDCHVAGHKTYRTIGSAGLPVSMGSYDINCYAAIDIRFLGVRQDDILDRTRWGVFGSNFCKAITFDGCVISRSDAHCGVQGYVIRNSVLGWMGTNTIGFGEMLLENCTCYGDHLVGFREDYGCTWDGDLTLRHITWIPHPGTPVAPVMFKVLNDGQHDFGYPCTLPHTIRIEDVTVVDTNAPAGYGGPVLFMDFDPFCAPEDVKHRPYPLGRPERVIIRGLRTLSGKPCRLCDHKELFWDTEVIQHE